MELGKLTKLRRVIITLPFFVVATNCIVDPSTYGITFGFPYCPGPDPHDLEKTEEDSKATQTHMTSTHDLAAILSSTNMLLWNACPRKKSHDN